MKKELIKQDIFWQNEKDTDFCGKLLITKAMTLPYSESEITLAQMGETQFDYALYPSKAGFKTQAVNVEAAPPKRCFLRK